VFKPYKKYFEFTLLVFFMITTRAADLFVTHKYSQNLKFEANPLVSFLEFHWFEFIIAQIFLTSSIAVCLYYDLFVSKTEYPKDMTLPFSEFAPLHWFGRKRHLIFFLLAFAKDWDLRIKFIGFAGSRLLIFVGLVATFSWLGLAKSSTFEKAYYFCFPVFPYGLIVLGAVLLLYLFAFSGEIRPVIPI
jgi:hypothetical protein